MKKQFLIILLAAVGGCSEQPKKTGVADEVRQIRLITLDPGHFHAALIQKTMYNGIDSTVHVYAPEGRDLQLHLDKINGYNSRPEHPTRWNEDVYTGTDFVERMLREKKGNVIVMAGNNQKKTEYIYKAIDAGYNVLADKPMAIDSPGFGLLETAFADAQKKNLLLYDIMTERYEITNMLKRTLSLLPEVFGQQEKGTIANPGVTEESIHYFFKYVSGSILTRPPWFMDIAQEGEGITDVGTHLVDLVQWQCFPEQVINYKKDIQIDAAHRWTTGINLSQFNTLTNTSGFPDYLKKYVVSDTVLKIYSNGEVDYQLKGVHVKVSAKWAYHAPAGSGDAHFAVMRGTKANLVIRQGAEQQYQPTLYIEPVDKKDTSYAAILMDQIKKVQTQYPGISLVKTPNGWKVTIPEKYNDGHESHFAHVTGNFMHYFKEGKLPDWEISGMLAKYYTTTRAVELAHQSEKPAN